MARWLWLWCLPLIPWLRGSLMAEDEGYYGLQARWFLASGDWISLLWWQNPTFDRGIGVQWLQAIAMSLGGETTLMVRLPSILAAFAAVWLTYAIGCRFLPQPTALLGAAILAVTPLFCNYAHLGTQDLPLVAVELLGIWALLQPERRWWLITGLCLGLGFLLKSFMIALPAIALLPYVVQQQFKPLRSLWFYAGIGLGALPVALWLGLATQMYGVLVWQQLFGKLLFLSESNIHATNGLYYLWNLPLNGFPWVIIALFGIRMVPPRSRSLLLGYPLVLLILLSLFSTRTSYYGLQLLPFTALLAAIALMQWSQSKTLTTWIVISLGGFMLIAALGVGFTQPELQRYIPLLLALGLPWLSLWVWRYSTRAWLLSIIVAPWLALTFASQTLLWGDYSRDLQEVLVEPAIAQVLANETIQIAAPPETTSSRHQALILLGFYTPQLGQRFADIPPGYSWVSPDLTPTGDAIGTWQDWTLVRR